MLGHVSPAVQRNLLPAVVRLLPAHLSRALLVPPHLGIGIVAGRRIPVLSLRVSGSAVHLRISVGRSALRGIVSAAVRLSVSRGARRIGSWSRIPARDLTARGAVPGSRCVIGVVC